MPTFDLDQVPAAAPDTPAIGTAGDFAKTFAAGAADLGSNLAGLSRYFYEAGNSEHGADISRGIQKMFGAGGDAARDAMNPETRKLAASAITSPDFWEHPVLAASLKATGMSPSLIALAVPGGLVADTLAASMAVAGGGAALNAGAGIDEFYKKLDEMPDKELQDQSPKYAALREFMDEGAARAKFAREAQGWAPAINALIGAGASVVGPAGMAARSLAGGAGAVVGAGERGALGAGLLGAAEGAGGNAVQSGTADVLSQKSDVEANFAKDMDYARTANAALEGGAFGGVLGGVAGAVLHGRAPAPEKAAADTAKLDSADASVSPAQNTPTGPQPDTGRATAQPAAPVESVQVGNPQSAPARSETVYDKKKKARAAKNAPVEPSTPSGPDAAQTAAISSTEPATQTPDIPAALARLTAQTDSAPAPEPVPPQVTAPRPVPPEVQQASQNLDTGQNAPEQPAAIAAQQQQVGQGNRKAVMYPKGSPVPAKPDGLARLNTPRGVVDFDPKQISAKQVIGAVAQGRENEILGLGPVSKPEVMQRVAAGEQPVAVTERTPQGLEVKGAVGTEQTAPEQARVLEANKTPGNTVQLENPAQTVAARAEAPKKGRVLRDLRQEETPDLVQKINVKENLPAEVELDADGNPVRGGKRYSDEEKAALEDRKSKAREITDRHAPGEGEADYVSNPEHRNKVIERAQAMVKEATDAGVKIPQSLRRSAKGNSASDDPSLQILTAARMLVRAREKSKTGEGKAITEAAARFREDEGLVRKGYSGDMLERRRVEGDQAMNRRVADESRTSSEGGGGSTQPSAAARVADNSEERIVKTKAGTEEKVTGAQAASGEKLSTEAKAKLIAEMNAKLRPPTKASAEKNALRVDRNPTEAQKEAGNYKKGHRRVEGLDFTIENPKGAVRRGRGPDGEWQVRMPADYGYIRRTVGADGDHIDAYDLRNGSRHFVVDQLDHRTGAFDEHKVILRAKDEASARDAYEKAFSDGKGADRIGHIHELSTDELKDWLKTGDHEKSHLENLVRDMDRVNFDEPTHKRGTVDVIGGGRVKVERTARAADELAKLDFSKMPGVGGVLGKFFANRLAKLAGDTEVHYVTPEVMAELGVKDALGLHVHDAQSDTASQVFISTAAPEGVGRGSKAHVLLHELAHRVTVRELASDPRAQVQIAKLAREAYASLNRMDVALKYGDKIHYGFTNAKEFIAEAFSNEHFQDFLANTPISKELAAELGLHRKSMSMWDVFRGFVKKAIEKVTGKMPEFDSVLDGMMRVSENLTKTHEVVQAALKTGEEPIKPRAEARQEAQGYVEKNALKMMDDSSKAVKRLLEDARMNTRERGPAVLKLRTFDNIAQISDHYFGENNPVRKIYNAVEKMRVKAEDIFARSTGPMLKKLVELRAQNPEQFREFSSLLHDATVANVHPDVALADAKNAHLGKKRVVGDAVWAKAQHKELSARYEALSPGLKEAWHDVVKHFTEQQNKMSLGIIENRILKTLGIEDEGLARRIHEGNATDVDRARVGEDMFKTIEEAGELSKIEGPYVPLMRRGDHVVKGDIKVVPPADATVLHPNEFEFTDQKKAEGYAKSSDLKATIKKVWVDEQTGKTHEADPVTGDTTKISAKDLHAVPRWRVEVQNHHVEFIQGRAAAERRAAELAADGSMDVHKVVPRTYEPGGREATELSAALQRLVSKLEKSEAYKQSTPTQQAALRQAVEEAAMASHGSTRVQSKSLPRRSVAGYNEDLIKNTAEYGESSSRYLAKLEHAPELEAGMKAMEAQLKADHSKVNQYGRTMIRNEVVQRVNGDNGYQQGGKFAPIVKRAMALSFIDKLASPAYSVINAMQPAMVTMPYLSGRHGLARTVAALSRAYSDISAGSIIKQGLKETGRRLKGSGAPDDFITNAKGLLKDADERAMIDHMVAHGVVDPSAGMEIRELTKDYSGVGGKIDAGIGYLEGVTREMPRAIEAINRMSTALAAYRLERARGSDHGTALTYAQDAVNNTQFNYSPTNAPPLFNHPLAKMAFQFKKYGQGMYQLIGGQIGKAYRNASPKDRQEAVKTLIALAGTHMAMAGALGLPTEPFKYLVMASGLVGGPQWGDVEDKIRKVAADVFGKPGGEVFSRGLPRLINLDLSRVGLDSVTSFGEPRSGKDADVKSWLFDTLAGPVAALGVDYAKGINQIANGNFEKAAENMIPIKAASDALRAYRQATEGKKSASGKQTSAPYSFAEAAMRTAGFGSGREAEEGAANSSYYRNAERQKEERSSLMSSWVSAKPVDKASAMSAITAWNRKQPEEAKITPKQLTDALKRREKETPTRGIVATKQTKRFLQDQPYNVR
jgi:hypothetical protein